MATLQLQSAQEQQGSYGVGIHPNIVTASLLAILSACNRNHP
ncbi:MAG: alpha-isopropylmalate synthase regulatory domain-containing protein [Cyanobacteria bacterium P01_A01_bin.17]